MDEYKRGNPRSCVGEYLKATCDGDFDRAANYLDHRNLPRWMDEGQRPDLARQLNLQIMREFAKEGIKFAFPTSTTYLTQDDGDHLQVSIAGDSQPTGQNEAA